MKKKNEDEDHDDRSRCRRCWVIPGGDTRERLGGRFVLVLVLVLVLLLLRVLDIGRLTSGLRKPPTVCGNLRDGRRVSGLRSAWAFFFSFLFFSFLFFLFFFFGKKKGAQDEKSRNLYRLSAHVPAKNPTLLTTNVSATLKIYLKSRIQQKTKAICLRQVLKL